MGGFQRIVVRVLNVQNASVEVQYWVNIVNYNIVAALLTEVKLISQRQWFHQQCQCSGYSSSSATPAPAAPTVAATPQATPTTSTAARTTIAPSTTAAPVVQTPAVSPASTYKVGDRGPAGGTVFYPVVRTSSVPPATAQTYKVGDIDPSGGIIFYVNFRTGIGSIWKWPLRMPPQPLWGKGKLYAQNGTGRGTRKGKHESNHVRGK